MEYSDLKVSESDWQPTKKKNPIQDAARDMGKDLIKDQKKRFVRPEADELDHPPPLRRGRLLAYRDRTQI